MRKSDAVIELERLVNKKKREAHPAIPEHALPVMKFSDQNTNGLTECIIQCFRVHGFFATRIDSKGTYNQALQRFIPSKQRKGLPDVFGQVPGLPPLWIEVKCAATNDRLKPHQKATIEELQESGALVYVAHSFTEFYEWFKDAVLNRSQALQQRK